MGNIRESIRHFAINCCQEICCSYQVLECVRYAANSRAETISEFYFMMLERQNQLGHEKDCRASLDKFLQMHKIR